MTISHKKKGSHISPNLRQRVLNYYALRVTSQCLTNPCRPLLNGLTPYIIISGQIWGCKKGWFFFLKKMYSCRYLRMMFLWLNKRGISWNLTWEHVFIEGKRNLVKLIERLLLHSPKNATSYLWLLLTNLLVELIPQFKQNPATKSWNIMIH